MGLEAEPRHVLPNPYSLCTASFQYQLHFRQDEKLADCLVTARHIRAHVIQWGLSPQLPSVSVLQSPFPLRSPSLFGLSLFLYVPVPLLFYLSGHLPILISISLFGLYI